MNMPPLYAVLCFATVGRKSSIKLAAQELHVTPGAVSQQLSKLEDILGTQLFIRSSRRMELTEAGRTYLRAVEPALRRISEATRQVVQTGPHVITVSCTSGFAMQWLLPRLAEFRAMEPGTDIRINTTNTVVELLDDEVDFAVRHGLGTYPGLEAERLIGDCLQPMCSPALLAAAGRQLGPLDLSHFPLLHDEHRGDWRLWLRAVGADDTAASEGTIFVKSSGAIDAAVASQGIALLRKSMVREELASGKLVVPLHAAIETPIAYHLVYDSSALLVKQNQRFRQWLISQAQADQKECAVR